MTVPVAKVAESITQYFIGEILPLMTGGNPFVTNFLGSIIGNKAPGIIEQYADMPILKTAEIIDKDGGVDIDLLYDAAKKGMAKSEGAFKLKLPYPMGTVTLTDTDIEKINGLCRQ